MPVDYSKYHPDWRDIIRPEILKRDKYKCTRCKVGQRWVGYRTNKGVFVPCDDFEIAHRKRHNLKVITIYLAVAHLDHDIQNNEYINLAAMCQKCHNNYDQQHRLINRLSRKL